MSSFWFIAYWGFHIRKIPFLEAVSPFTLWDATDPERRIKNFMSWVLLATSVGIVTVVLLIAERARRRAGDMIDFWSFIICLLSFSVWIWSIITAVLSQIPLAHLILPPPLWMYGPSFTIGGDGAPD